MIYKMSEKIDSSSELTASNLKATEPISNPTELFWNFVKPHLKHVSKDDLNWLKGLILSYNTNLAKIPPLGKHYTKVWAREMFNKNSTQSSDHAQLGKSIVQINSDVLELVNKVNHAIHDGNVATPIFQRVTSALREHTHSYQKENIEFECTEDGKQNMSNFYKQFIQKNTIENQLVNIGLIGRYSKPVFPPSISESDVDVDEVLEELIKCDISLIQVQKNNRNDLTTLFEKCYRDYHEQKIRNKINEVNTKILKLKKRSSKKSKQKNVLTLKKNNQMSVLLDQRNNYLSELNDFILSEISNQQMFNDPQFSDEFIKLEELLKTKTTEQNICLEQDIIIDDDSDWENV